MISDLCLVTDSAYGFLTGMVFLQLWEILWVTSLRIAQRVGFLGVEEIRACALEQPEKGKALEPPEKGKAKRNFCKEIKL